MTAELTYRQAAARVERSVRTLWRWRKQGMPMGWSVRDGQRVRVVREDVLLAWWRARMAGWPIHQQRMRALARLEETNEMQAPSLLNRAQEES